MACVAVPHGGNLAEAVRRYGIAREEWIDLSTGINPCGYPVPDIDAQAWLRLPDDDDDLEAIAAAHYGAPRALAVAGTQAAIRMLPQVLPVGRIGIGLLTYGEYAPAFAAAGFTVERFVTELFADRRDAADFLLAPGARLPAGLTHLVVVNPNNPGTESFDAATLLDWHRQLVSRGGGLIVDEAFVEATPHLSVASHVETDGLVVLRSVGKFYGLAGARAGFALAPAALHDAMRGLRGPWTVSGPARSAVRAALLDEPWQRSMRTQLRDASARLVALLERHGLRATHTPLFAWLRCADAARWQDALARRAVWVRRFDVVPGLRFGLPADERAWDCLDRALREASTRDGTL
jgi:cobalamin biosynthesis protein CobC